MTTPDDHHQHRSRRESLARKTIVADIVYRIVLILLRLVSIPFAVRVLGNERYGLWLTAGSVLLWLNLSQMGLNDGLLNELSKAFGRNDRSQMQRHVSTAYCCFVVIAIVVAVAISILSRTPFAISFLGVKHAPHLVNDAHAVFLLTGLLLAATLLVNAASAVFGGIQETYLYYIFFAIGNLLVLGVLAILTQIPPSLVGFTLAMAVPPLLVTALGTIYLFGWRYPFLRPRLRLFSTESLRSLMHFGGPLLVIQITEMVIFNSANPMIASRLGVGEVPRYAVPLSMFLMVSSFCNGIARAYLAGYVEAFVRKDWHWMQSATRRLRLQTGGLMALAAVAIILVGPWVIRVWAGKSVVPSTTMLICMGVYCFLMTLTNTNFVVMLGLGQPRIRAACAIFIALSHIAGFFILMPRLQLLALPVAGSFGYLGDILVATIYTSRFFGKRLKESTAESPPAPRIRSGVLTPAMNVSISVAGRFHAFDLAWQLQKRGFLRTLITSYPKFKVKEWHVGSDRTQSVISHEVLCRGWRLGASKLRLKGKPDYRLLDRYDRIASTKIPAETDLLVVWSGAALHSLQRAHKLGAKTVLERNSTHIIFQRDILIEEYGLAGVRPSLPDPRIVRRELEEYETTDYICVPSTFAYRSFIECGVPAGKIFTVPFGVDHNSFFPLYEQRDSLFRVIHCGALSIRKGVHYLLQAFHELQLPNSELWLIGPMTGEITPYLAKYGSSNIKVRGTFPQGKLHKEYAQGSVFCLASVEEGFAMVISQAMACGLPVICTTNTTAGDIVRDGLDGFVIPIRDVQAIKERLALLHADRDRCRDMGESARARVLGSFTWDHYGERMTDQYSRILRGQPPVEYRSLAVERG